MIQKVKSFLFENNSTKQTIIKNTFWSGASQILCTLIKASFVFYVARVLGAAEYGRMNAAMSFTAMFLIFGDFGVSVTALKEMAHTDNEDIINNIFSLRLALSIFYVILTSLIALYYWPDFFLIRTIAVFVLFNFITGLVTIISSYFTAKQHAQYGALVDVGSVVIVSTFGIIFLNMHPSAVVAALSYCLGAFFSLFFFFFFFRKLNFLPKFRFEYFVWKRYFFSSLPYAIAGVFSTACSNIDIFILGLFKQYESIGFYSAAYKIINIASIPMGIISGSFFPSLNNLFHESKEKYARFLCVELEIAIVLSFAIALGGWFLAGRIIDYIYDPRYLPAVIALQIFSIATVPFLLMNPFSHMAVIEGKRKVFITAWATNFIINFLLDIYLIPKYSYVGAAIATLVANIFFIAIVYLSLWRHPYLHIFDRKIVAVLFFSMVSCAVMGLLLFFLEPYSLHILFTILLGGVAYLSIYFLQRRLFFGSFTG